LLSVPSLEMRQNTRIIVSFAVRSEFAPWRRLRNFERVGDPAARVYSANGSGAGIDVVLTGVGGRNLAAMHKLLEEGTDIFIVSGLAGSLKREHAVGTVLVAKTIKRNNADKVMMSDDSLVKLAVQCGATPVDSFFTSDVVVASASEKLRLGATADAVEMESFHLMAEARRYRVPAVAIRAISDGVDENLPLDFNRTIDEDGEFAWLPALSQLVSSPSRLPRLVRFGFETSKSARNLAHFLDRYLKCLITQADSQLNSGRVEV